MLILIAIVIGLRDSITFVKTFADRLRFARISRHLTQAELAQASGLSQSAIANYENGSRRSAKNIFRLAEALQVRAQWLAEGKGGMDAVPHENDAYPAAKGASALVLSDPRQVETPWPFQNIRPETYWALDAASRTVIENTVASLMASLKK